MATLEELFPGHYYYPTEEDLSLLWKGGTFVVDANVLLQLYALPETTRNETLNVLGKLKDRLWMPYQVAVEFQRNRIRAIGQSRDRVAKVIEPLKDSLARFEAAVADVQLEKRGLTEASDKMRQLLEVGRSVIDDAQSALAGQVDLTGADPIRAAIGNLFAERIGSVPSQEKLDQWYAEAKERYKHKMGPGFDDASKKDPTFKHGGVVYNKAYGDYVLWRQSIDYARSNDEVTDLVIVTEDKKPDWWLKYNDRMAGPHPELVSEVRSEAHIDRFWMYDLEEFLQVARVQLEADVSETTLSDVADASADAIVNFVSRVKRSRETRASMGMSAETMQGYLKELHVMPQLHAAYYAAGVRSGTDGHWVVATDMRHLGKFITHGAFKAMVEVLQTKGAEIVNFYCFTDGPANPFEREAFSGFANIVMENKALEDLVIAFFLKGDEGKFELTEAGVY